MNGARALFFIALGLVLGVPLATWIEARVSYEVANRGVVLGAAVGGGFIDAVGMQGTVWSGWLFAALAMAAVLARKPWRLGRQATMER